MSNTPDALPTSDLSTFREMLNTPNTPFDMSRLIQKTTAVMNIVKNFVLSIRSDSSGCGHIRNVFPLSYLNAVYSKQNVFDVIQSPVLLFQHEVLARTKAIFFQRTMDPGLVPAVAEYKRLQSQLKFKMVYDIDDFIWNGLDEGESIPEYNFGRESITPAVVQANIETMKMMDVICVSTKFLGEYIVEKFGISKDKIKVIHNSIPQYFWGTGKKKPIKAALTKPKIVWTASPTHWHDAKRLKGDLDNAWYEWIRSNVLSGKIDFIQMGGLPWFFEDIADKITVVPWVNSYQYHTVVKSLKADFSIGPLVPNYFNYSKSCIKYQEACASGSVFIGTTFANGKDSPYDVCKASLSNTATVADIDALFETLKQPESYNKVVAAQYAQMESEGWWQESKEYVNLLMSAFN